MDTQLRNVTIIIVVALVVLGVVFYFLWPNTVNGNRVEGQLSLQELAGKSGCQLPAEGQNLDDFAKCIKDSGAMFYGAFWCPHCQDQKALFGDSAKYLPYVECSTADSKGQLQVCTDQNIQVYPTWIFKPSS